MAGREATGRVAEARQDVGGRDGLCPKGRRWGARASTASPGPQHMLSHGWGQRARHRDQPGTPLGHAHVMPDAPGSPEAPGPPGAQRSPGASAARGANHHARADKDQVLDDAHR